jgi:hypothetical protein
MGRTGDGHDEIEADETGTSGKGGEQWQAYDHAMRRWGESNLAEVASWLQPGVAHRPEKDFVRLSTAFAVPVIHADLLAGVGDDLLLHVEYESRSSGEIVRRMYDYRGRIMREHPGKRLEQYVIVLARGKVTGYADLELHGFALDLHVICLREHRPAEFLTRPLLAPFAALAHGTTEERAKALGAAMRLLSHSSHPRAPELLRITEALARLRLSRTIIHQVTKENSVEIESFIDVLRREEAAQIEEDAWDAGTVEGERQGLRRGRQEGRGRILLALLRARFGDSPDVREAAELLATWDDEEAAVRAITAAAEPRALLDLRANPAPGASAGRAPSATP